MQEVLDLDILRPKKVILKLNEKEIDVSFVPAGITFEVDELIRDLSKIPIKKIEEGKADAKRAFEISLSICSLFTAHNYPEMTKEWFLKNVSAPQVNVFVHAVKNALAESYKGIEAYGKN
jgi:hypothetical protein